jgi:hypothetical protein
LRRAPRSRARSRADRETSAPIPTFGKAADAYIVAVPYRDLPDFAAKLRSTEGLAAKALALVILCASRRSEVLGMT